MGPNCNGWCPQKKTDTQGEGHVTMRAETGAVWLQPRNKTAPTSDRDQKLESHGEDVPSEPPGNALSHLGFGGLASKRGRASVVMVLSPLTAQGGDLLQQPREESQNNGQVFKLRHLSDIHVNTQP